jgi:hypothetical protein
LGGSPLALQLAVDASSKLQKKRKDYEKKNRKKERKKQPTGDFTIKLKMKGKIPTNVILPRNLQ